MTLVKWFAHMSWDELDGVEVRDGITVWSFPVGPPDGTERPEVVRVRYAPGTVVEPHTHDADYTEIILEGDETVGRRRHGAGDIRIVKAGTVYGPTEAGPDGTLKLVVFATEGARMLSPSDVRPPTSGAG